jgi:hypothetical protein
MFSDLDLIKSFIKEGQPVPINGEWDEDLSEISQSPVRTTFNLKKPKINEPEIIISLQGAD